jgi:hypothetical protein
MRRIDAEVHRDLDVSSNLAFARSFTNLTASAIG